MKVICDAPGQTCNRLWSYVTTIATCVVKKQRMAILFYDYTIDDFPNLRDCPFIWFPFYQAWLLRRGNNWNRFKSLTWKATHSPLMDKVYHLLGFFKGWHTRRQIECIPAAKQEIIRIFTPRIEIVEQASGLIDEMRSQSDKIIGVHIRRGDYRTWVGGRFFFELSQYHAFMLRVQALYSGQRVAFFISSNEEFSTELFSGCTCYRFTDNASAVLDLYALSQCDLLMGPVSSFSRWASFYGEKPLCFLEDAEQEFTQDSFSPIVDFFHFANGREMYDW